MSEMNAFDWEEANQKYLSAALTWLILRLERLIASRPAKPAAVEGSFPASDSLPGGRWGFLRARGSSQPQSGPRRGDGDDDVPKEREKPRPTGGGRPGGGPTPPPTGGGPSSPLDAQIAQAKGAMDEAAQVQPPPALLNLAERLGLSSFETEVVLLCAAMELDTRTAWLCSRAQEDGSGQPRPYPTFALALALFDGPAWEALSPESPLRYFQLIEVNQPNDRPLAASGLRADERIVNYIKGLNYLDDRISPLLAPFDTVEEHDLPVSQQVIVTAILQQLTAAGGTGRPPVMQLVGPDGQSKSLIAAQIASELGLRVVRLPGGLLPTSPGELETLARLWQREGILLPLALYLESSETHAEAPSAGGFAAALNRFLVRSNGLFFLDTREPNLGLDRGAITFDVSRPTPVEQRHAWTAALHELDTPVHESGNEDAEIDPGPEASQNPEPVAEPQAEDIAAQLSGQFDLNLPTIRHIVQAAGALSEGQPGRQERLWNACRMHTRPRLDALAQRLDPKATWKDIVLPREQRHLLQAITRQVVRRSQVYDDWGFRARMNRGLGISVLFAGASGTGKTMAAEVIANFLCLDLFRIDLSGVVSKYIGETEKNLRQLFDAADYGGAILFFDEADALFGKRSEVKDSHDRYANIEINYLLQRMEAYRGLAILATNLKSSLDPAFLRRLRFIVNFPFPGVRERREIWQKAFPRQTPSEGLDFNRLAQLNLTGGSIHNIVLNAAFLAARMGGKVTMPIVLEAARAEFRKLERPFSEADLRWSPPAARQPISNAPGAQPVDGGAPAEPVATAEGGA